MKKILVLLFVFLLGMPVFSEIITGGVECSVEDARSDVFHLLRLDLILSI